MTSRKNQNSILFLTTLGVYLGLVLVGATPQVLAQAATAKQFNIKDEIGARDKLDNDPDDCSVLSAKVRERQAAFAINERAMFEYANALVEILKEFGKLPVRPEEFNWVTSSGNISTMENGRPVLVPATWVRTVELQVRQLRALSLPAFDDGASFQLQADAKQLVGTLIIKAPKDIDAHMAKVAFDTNLDFWRCDVTQQRVKTLLEHTEVTWLESQVIITTRLPRGSLDSLLATDAK